MIVGNKMYIGIFFRTLFMICVPLFIIVTGYLMKDKKLSKKYYFSGGIRVLLIYLLDSVLFLSYNAIYNNGEFNIKYIIKSILSFDIGYAWYIEMYFGLFLLIPFISFEYNIICFNPLESDRNKVIPIMIDELSRQLGYNEKRFKNIINELSKLKDIQDRPIIKQVINIIDGKKRISIIVNPNIIYAGRDVRNISDISIIFKRWVYKLLFCF